MTDTAAAHKRFTDPFKQYEPTDMADALMCVMIELENALLDIGAAPGVDYKHADLIALANPYVVELFKNGRLAFTAGIPMPHHWN